MVAQSRQADLRVVGARALRCSSFAVAVVAFALGNTAAGAAAQKSHTDPAAAAQAFRAGVAAATSGRWEEARDAFDLSYRLRPHPDTLLNLAGAQAQTGRIKAALVNYRLYLEERPATADDTAMRRAAADYVTKLEARLATLTVDVRGALDGDVIRLDDDDLARGPGRTTTTADPGAHVLRVVRAGTEVHRVELRLADAETKSVAVDVPVTPTGVALLGQGGATPAERDDPSVLETWWFWTGAAVLVAAATVTILILASQPSAASEGNLGSTQVPLR